MEKIILVDGNNLLFRSYFATAYSGNVMRNSSGFPTNALYGFTNMINKIVAEEKPKYILVAFDKGKTFRHNEYSEYKGGRNATPEYLKMQMPLARELLNYMGIKYYEIDNYEADDIIGTFSEYCNNDDRFDGTIISSDKDLLQLISDHVNIKLLKTKDYIRYDKNSFKESYGIDPVRVIDLKALMGDASDNIPGVKGIGEKTALKLLQQYDNLDNVYAHVDELSAKTKEKLLQDKDNAYLSYHLATIVKDVPVDINIDDLLIKDKDVENLNKMYEKLEFYSLLRKNMIEKKVVSSEISFKDLKSTDSLYPDSEIALSIEMVGTNYHTSQILGFGIYSEHNSYFLSFEEFKKNPSLLDNFKIITYDLKKVINALKWQNITLNNIIFDTMIAGYLLDYNVKDDASVMASMFNYEIKSFEEAYGKTKISCPTYDVYSNISVSKAKFIYETKDDLINKLKDEQLLDLYYDTEVPLAYVLADMEFTGVNVDKNCLYEMDKDLKQKILDVTNQIYEYAGGEFNINSSAQLANVLFEKIGLNHGKKNQRGFSTSIEVLNKLKGTHPIIDLIIEHRLLNKIESTYVIGILNSILSDNKVHTIYTQTLTRTGRLSSIEPNLQNIPVRNEFGKLIRKAFVPSEDSVILSADYSQIELRILSHMANIESLVSAFNNNIDIHTKTASDIFHINEDEVTSNMRRIAKAVNFGIIYGISSYGLAENLGIRVAEAKEFMDKYNATYPGIIEYMDNVKKEAYKNGYVKTLFNRKRIIPELQSKNHAVRASGERMALNTPIQGTSADIIKKAMIEVFDAFKKENLKSKMILQVHDELVFDCRRDELDKVIEIVTNIMENTYKLNVPLKVDVNYGDNWYLAK